MYNKLSEPFYRLGLIFLGSTLIVIGSNCRKSNQTNKPTNNSVSSASASTETENCPYPDKGFSVKSVQKIPKVKEDQQAIVLLHGLQRHSYDFTKMMEALKQRFPHAQIVALTELNKKLDQKSNLYRAPSMMLSIKAQAEQAYIEIKEKLKQNKHVVLVGHSQGGLRGFTMVKEYGEVLRNESNIIIKHLITIGTPWLGAPLMNYYGHSNKVDQALDDVKDTLEKIKKGYRESITKHIFKFYMRYDAFSYFADSVSHLWQGAADLKPEGNFIRYVTTTLRNIGIPITAIAGINTDFSKLFERFPNAIQESELQKLNETYATLLGGDKRCEHDMLLPISTQHAEGLEKKDFTTITVPGACHGNKVGIQVKPGVSALNNEKVIQTVIATIEKTFYTTQAETIEMDAKLEVKSSEVASAG